jgi:phage tail-like protein
MAIDNNLLGPYPACYFFIALIDTSSAFSTLTSGVAGFLLGGFAECSGLDASLEIQEFKEGGVNDRVHKFPTRSTFANINLKRGVGFGEDLWLWYEEFLNGEGTRRNGLIVLANELRVPIKIWSFENAIPVKWSGPSFNASTSAIAIESIEIAHEKLTLNMSPGKALDGLKNTVF